MSKHSNTLRIVWAIATCMLVAANTTVADESPDHKGPVPVRRIYLADNQTTVAPIESKITGPKIGPIRKVQLPCIPYIRIGPTGQIIKQGCAGSPPASACQEGSALTAQAVGFRVHDIAVQGDGTVSGSLESTVNGCDGTGQISVTQVTLYSDRWQYKPNRANRNGVYFQSLSGVPTQGALSTYPHVAGAATSIPFVFRPLAPDMQSPQAPPAGSLAYCAFNPRSIHVVFTIAGQIGSSDAEVPWPHAIHYGPPGSGVCPMSTAEACVLDPALAVSETCHPGLRSTAFCLSAYQNDYLDSHGFCNDAATFSNAMQATWGVLPMDAVVRDWVDQPRPSSLSEFMGNGPTRGNSADILFLETHGGVNPQDARLALWPNNEEIRTQSDGVRLGEFPGRVSVLVLSSCWVLSGSNVDYGDSSVDGDKYDGSAVEQPVNSGWMFDRWANVFRGGLKIAVGGADGETFSDGILSSTDDNPSTFVQYMTNRPIVDAFTEAWQNWDVDQHVGGIASGMTPADCLNRLQSLRFSALNSVPRLYDADVRFLCQVHVFNDSIF